MKWLTLLFSILVLTFATAATPEQNSADKSAEKSEKKAAAETPSTAPATPSTSCLTDIEIIRELKARRDGLEAKEKELNALREELKQREAITLEELKKLEVARAELLKTEGSQKAEVDTKVTKLVETLELMPPKASAKVMTELEDSLAVVAMGRISNAKLAKILAAMDPKRSSALSQLLARGKKAKL